MKNVIIVVAALVLIGGIFWWSLSSKQAPTAVPVTTTGYKDGKYTGTVSNSVYGPVQVALTITGGKIVGVDVPVYPNAAGHTTDVSAMSLPILKQEVITVQGAHVDTVSGATQTSEAFNESLASALSQAS